MPYPDNNALYFSIILSGRHISCGIKVLLHLRPIVLGPLSSIVGLSGTLEIKLYRCVLRFVQKKASSKFILLLLLLLQALLLLLQAFLLLLTKFWGRHRQLGSASYDKDLLLTIRTQFGQNPCIHTGSSRKNVKSKSVCTGVDFHKKSISGWKIAANLSHRASGTITITLRHLY